MATYDDSLQGLLKAAIRDDDPRERERVQPLDVDVSEVPVADALRTHHVRDQVRDERLVGGERVGPDRTIHEDGRAASRMIRTG